MNTATTKRPPKAARCETASQAHRWDLNRNRAAELGICDRCGPQFADGLAIGFTLVRPPCRTCAEIVDTWIGAPRPNGWRVHPRAPRHSDTRKCSGAPETRLTDPATGIDGFGRCRLCGQIWTGFSVCHCSACCVTFAGVDAFDRHRLRGRCQDPESRGLTKTTRAHWIGWTLV